VFAEVKTFHRLVLKTIWDKLLLMLAKALFRSHRQELGLSSFSIKMSLWV
jgi:hypothetical protein